MFFFIFYACIFYDYVIIILKFSFPLTLSNIIKLKDKHTTWNIYFITLSLILVYVNNIYIKITIIIGFYYYLHKKRFYFIGIPVIFLHLASFSRVVSPHGHESVNQLFRIPKFNYINCDSTLWDCNNYKILSK